MNGIPTVTCLRCGFSLALGPGATLESAKALTEAHEKSHAPPRWEYVETPDMSAEHLAELGGDGWELVAVIHREWRNELKGHSGTETVGYFKRPIVEES